MLQDILKQCTVEGLVVKLPNIQLDRADYIEVKKSLELIGGSWKGGKVNGFVFKEDPTDYLEQLCSGEKRNLKKEFQFFGTPPSWADRLVELAFELPCLIGAVLEPSAGQGAIINAIHRHDSNIEVKYCELMDLNIQMLSKISDKVQFIAKDFLSIDQPNYYAQIIANPPFSKNQDIDHVYKMYECLADDGRLVSIMSNHWRNTSGKKETEFQKFIKDTNAYVEEIPAGAFKESGTNISACIVVINKCSENRVNEKKQTKKQNIEIRTKEKPLKPDDIIQKFADSFNQFAYKFSQAEAFIDFIDYVLLVFKWQEKDRDFSYFEKKYRDMFPNLLSMFELLSEASDNRGEGFRDALGDLFMELVSGGRNGQYFTPDNICDMIGKMTIGEIKDGQTILDPACGSSRMLLAAAKRNRNALFYGCDNDITCCKMSVLNMLMNTMSGEIAHMNSLTMEYYKSWETGFVVRSGMNIPVYRVIENKEDSPLWQMHINSFADKTRFDDIKPEKQDSEVEIEMSDEFIENHRSKYPIAFEELTKYSSYDQILGKTPQTYTPEERFDRWSKVMSLDNTIKDMFSDTTVCHKCIHLDIKNCWCKDYGLPCSYNPILKMIGMACGGGGRQLKRSKKQININQLQLELF